MTVGNNGNGNNSISGRESEWLGFGGYVEHPRASGLEGRLQGVKVGDFLLLSSPEVRVAGFVGRWDQKRVELTYFDPNCTYEFDREKIVKERYVKGNRQIWHFEEADTPYLTPENRTYNLKKFQQYALLPDTIPASNSNGYSPLRNLIEVTLQRENGRESFVGEARIGDLVLLDDSKLRVGGFVFKKSEYLLTLSHVDPNSELQGSDLCRGSYAKGWLFYGHDPVIFNTITFKQALLFPRIREVPREKPENKEVAVENNGKDDAEVPLIISDFSSRDNLRRK